MSEDGGGPFRGEVRRAGFRKVSHGLYRPETRLGVQDEWVRDLDAWRLVLPDDAVFTHVTAAALTGWWLPQLPEWVPAFAATSEARRPRRAGLVVSRLERVATPQLFHGLPVDDPSEVLLRCARDLALLDLVPMVDSAFRAGHLKPGPMAELCETSRPGVRPLRTAVSLSDPRSESGWETLLRLFHWFMDVPVDAQQVLLDRHGQFVARADLLVRGTRFVHEYDGSEHRRADRHRDDLRRDRRLIEAGYLRRGYTASDLLVHPRVVLAELDRSLGRRHRPGRVRRWLTLVDRSTYSVAGRNRLLNRWWRLTGPC